MLPPAGTGLRCHTAHRLSTRFHEEPDIDKVIFQPGDASDISD
jgi:hypothetical protein